MAIVHATTLGHTASSPKNKQHHQLSQALVYVGEEFDNSSLFRVHALTVSELPWLPFESVGICFQIGQTDEP